MCSARWCWSGWALGISFVPMTLSATAGVPPHEAGLASGLINTSRQIGGAVGLAVMATVATTVATNHLAGRHDLAAALTAGYRVAFAIAGGGLIVGALLALALPKLPAATAPGGRPRRDTRGSRRAAPGLRGLTAPRRAGRAGRSKRWAASPGLRRLTLLRP